MKSLGRTIDKLIKVDPNLQEKLLPIKSKWLRYPAKSMNYWQELIDFLNSDSVKTHPKINEIKQIIVSKRVPPQPMYTFEDAIAGDHIIGVIPENVSDMIRRHDRKVVALSKKQIECNMTHNTDLATKLAREELLMEISMKKIWLVLKDSFQLWNKALNYTIKKHNGALVLVEQMPMQQIPNGQMILPNGNVMRINPAALKDFLKNIGMGIDPGFPDNPPPDDLPPQQ